MKNLKLLSVFILIGFLLFTAACKQHKSDFGDNRDRDFNKGWKFIKDSIAGAEQPGYNDLEWRTIDLPHDWSIEKLTANENDSIIGPFTKSSVGNTATGYVLGGTGWYRKHFTVEKADEGKIFTLKFDGVYMESEVWVNGRLAGKHVYGYTPFFYDITEFLNKPGTDNVVAVKVENKGRNSRWYSGSGIYRNVTLSVTEPVHIAVWGVYATAEQVNETSAQVKLGITVNNHSKEAQKAKIKIKLVAPGSLSEQESEHDLLLSADGQTIFNQETTVSKPVLWSPSSPGIYQAVISVNINGKTVDQFIQPFGIRTIEVSADKGFLLNGKTIELKGGCMHHDNGLLGSAAFSKAEERRVQIMKNNGFNAIRTSHNPPSEAFLNACDRIGMLVIDETFDMWQRPKNPMDYHRFFNDWWKKDVESMILRDRNHPSVVIWSIGNEINERADTSGLRIARSLIDYIKTLDTTRPFTNAICDFWDIPGTAWEKTAPAYELLDIGGYNYLFLRYESDHEKYPQRVMMGTESVPQDAYGNWKMVEEHPWVIGDFVWTGMDYFGETGIGHTQYFVEGQTDNFSMPWPWFNSWCGDIDITGNKKPQMYYRDVLWNNSKLEMNVHAPVPEGKTEKVSYWGWPDEYPHWNWNGNEDKMLKVSVYTTGTSVKLVLNGREIGRKEVSPATKLTAVFDVPYEPGELKAIAYDGEQEIAEKTFKTTGSAYAIRLKTDCETIKADRNELAYVAVEVTDEFGQTVTDATIPVTIEVSGAGELQGSGNACPYDMKSIGKNTINTFHGNALVILRPFEKSGKITVKASSQGLKEGSISVSVED